MAININDLDDNLQPVGASLLSGNESIMDNLRELSDEELKASGGGKGKVSFSLTAMAPSSLVEKKEKALSSSSNHNSSLFNL